MSMPYAIFNPGVWTMNNVFLLLSRRLRTALLTTVFAMVLPTIGLGMEFSDAKLQSFAKAVIAINQIAEEWQPKVQAATSEDQAATMLQQVDTEMRQVIESTDDLDIDEYQQIMAAAQDAPELKSQIDGMVKEMTAN
ncbi:MAG: DUF4168 domain-containing protein [Geminicoccaceae bacterium]